METSAYLRPMDAPPRAAVPTPASVGGQNAEVSAPTPLVRVAAETERHVARAGWDQSPRLFALVATADLLAHEPSLRPGLAGADPGDLSAVEQEGMPDTTSIESMLGRLAWPPEVLGVAFAVERIVVPPDAERDLPDDPEAAVAALAAHPGRQDVRVLAAVLRSGDHVCLVRQRAHDADHLVATGPDLAPGLVAALAAGFDDTEG